MTTRRTVVLLLVAMGCYRSHGVELDASVVDASPDEEFDASEDTGVDAGELRGWVLEARPATLSSLSESSCATVQEGTALVHTTVTINNTCERGGPSMLLPHHDAPGAEYRVRSHVWVHHPVTEAAGCFGVTAIAQRFVVIHQARDDIPEVIDDVSESRVVITVLPWFPGPRPTGDTEAGERCQSDLDCVLGLACIPEIGDPLECFGGRCARRCNRPPDALYGPDLDCPIGETCSIDDRLAAPICMPRREDACRGDCAQGLECTGSFARCEWSVDIEASAGRPCVRDDQCDSGLVCVRHHDGRLTCEIPCFTTWQRCPPMHRCGVASVCELDPLFR